MATTHFAAILTSPLQRAVMTAQTLLDAQPAPQPSLTASDLLREQHFGIAEGKPWTMKAVPHLSFADHVAKGIYISTYSRSEKFPGGESPDDLSRRAEKAVEELLLPYIWDTERDRSKNTHIAIVSHGLCIGAIMVALVKMDASGTRPSGDYYGLLNTAWARVSVEVNVSPQL
jgi:broad specificity phosphatase PhoE